MPQLGALSPQLNTAARSYGFAGIEVVASATTITPKGNFIRITGNTTISTITADPYIVGPLYLFNTDSSVGVTDTGGNIALATTLTRYKVFLFIYDVATTKWYPSDIS